MKFGIDVSSHQGKIDWDKVVGPTAYNGGPIDFVIFRGFIGSNAVKGKETPHYQQSSYEQMIGSGGLSGNTKFDTKFKQYFADFIRACDRAGRTPGIQGVPGTMSYGVYIIPYAMTTTAALLEAKACIEMLHETHLFPVDMDMGVWYDAEGEGGKGFSDLASLSKAEVGAICDTFCTALDKFGWRTGIYCNRNWTKNEIDPKVLAKWPLWMAAYTNSGKPTDTQPPEEPNIWQFTSKGKVEGIGGNCDVNVLYSEEWMDANKRR